MQRNMKIDMADKPLTTEEQFRAVMEECRALFHDKLHDYGASWRLLRPTSLTDQLYIKAKRIRSLEVKKESLVGEGIRPEFIAIINYGIIGLIQLRKGYVYDEAWRSMRVTSYTDFILTKLQRVKELEDIQGKALVSEGIDANYMDIVNYATFGAIKLRYE